MAEDGAVDVGGGVRYVNPMEEGEHVPPGRSCGGGRTTTTAQITENLIER